jgi:hypothetical protein
LLCISFSAIRKKLLKISIYPIDIISNDAYNNNRYI